MDNSNTQGQTSTKSGLESQATHGEQSLGSAQQVKKRKMGLSLLPNIGGYVDSSTPIEVLKDLLFSYNLPVDVETFGFDTIDKIMKYKVITFDANDATDDDLTHICEFLNSDISEWSQENMTKALNNTLKYRNFGKITFDEEISFGLPTDTEPNNIRISIIYGMLKYIGIVFPRTITREAMQKIFLTYITHNSEELNEKVKTFLDNGYNFSRTSICQLLAFLEESEHIDLVINSVVYRDSTPKPADENQKTPKNIIKINLSSEPSQRIQGVTSAIGQKLSLNDLVLSPSRNSMQLVHPEQVQSKKVILNLKI